MPSGPCVGPRCHSRYFRAPPAVATMSMSGAFEARMSAAVVPRPPRRSGVRASVAAKSVWVRLSMRPYVERRAVRRAGPGSVYYI